MVAGNSTSDGMSAAVTVLMAVYETPLPMLDRAIDSIRRQDYADFEFLILDDGSQSHALAACLDGHAAQDPRIRIAREPHRGLTAALNRGLELARGHLIARQDADDWSGVQRLGCQVRHFERHPATVALGSNAWTHQESGRRLWQTRLPESRAEILEMLPRGNPFIHGAMMFRRGEALNAGGYREQFRCAQDYDFFWRLAERSEVANLAAPLYHYRFASGSISAARATEQVAAHYAIKELAACRLRGEREDPARQLADSRRCLAQGSGVYRTLLKQADHLMLAGDYRGAGRTYLSLLRQYPGHPLGWGKLARLGVFRAIPFLREVCFR